MRWAFVCMAAAVERALTSLPEQHQKKVATRGCSNPNRSTHADAVRRVKSRPRSVLGGAPCLGAEEGVRN